MRYYSPKVSEDGWTEWHRARFVRCCDCALVHEMEFEVRSNMKNRKGEEVKVFFRARRDERKTAASRRYKKNDTN